MNKEGELGQPEPSQKTIPEPPGTSEASIPPSTEGGARAPPPAPNTNDQGAAGWPDVTEEVVNNSYIVAEHHALMDVVLKSIRSINSGLKEAFNGLLTGFEVSHVMFFSQN